MTAKNKTYLFGLITLGLFIAAYFPALKTLVGVWVSFEEYRHAFLTLPIILYMVWVKRDTLLASPTTYSSSGILLVIISTILYLFALLTEVRTFVFLSMFFTITGVLVYLNGVKTIIVLATPLLLLLMLIPVPEQLYPQLTFPLQLKVSQATEIIINMLNIPLFREGNVMNLPDRSFEVVEACSGLRSVITFLTFSVIIGYFTLQRTSSKLILIAASIPTAIFVNIIRVVTMILLFHYWKVDLTEGIWHSIAGTLIFGLALLTLFSLQKILISWETKHK